jgi:glutathione S-transferase
MPDATLITFPPSLDCELGRFLAGHYRIDYREERHAIAFSSFYTWRAGATVAFPLLYGPSYRLGTVRQIVDRFDPMAPDELKLLSSGADRAQVEMDWKTFNDTLAFATAIFGYYHLLPHREIMVRPLSEGAPDAEVRAVRSAYPVFAGLLRLLLVLTAGRAEQALGRARAVLQGVDDRLADGRAYLVGGRLSLSDLAFAVAVAPLVLPEGYGGPLPAFEEMPPMIQTAIVETRARPAGRFAQRIYRDHRAEGSARGSANTITTKGEHHELSRPA